MLTDLSLHLLSYPLRLCINQHHRMSDNLKQKVCLQIKVWWSTHPLIHFFIQLQLPTFVSALGLEIFQFYFHNTAKTNNKQKHLLKCVLLKIYEFSNTVQEKFYVCYIFMYLHNSFCFFLKLVLSLCQMACSPLLLPPFLPHKAFFFSSQGYSRCWR